MRLKLALTRPNGGTTDVVVTADANATVGEIAETLLRSDPEPGVDIDLPRVGDRQRELDAHTLSVAAPAQRGGVVLAPDLPIADAAVASGATVTVVPVSGDRGGAPTGPVLAVVRVVDGPDRGTEFPIRRGSSVIGRDESCEIVLHDSLVSKRHARIDVTRTVDVVDLNSANGVVVDGDEVSRVSLTEGQTVLIGGTTLRVQQLSVDDAPVREVSSRAVSFTRSPTVERRYPGTEYDGPEVPKELDSLPFPWIAFFAPLVAGIALYLFLRNPFTLVFVALAPVIMLGTYLGQRSAAKRKLKKAIERFDAKLERLDGVLTEERERERSIREDEAPSTERLFAEAGKLGPLMWSRRPEHWSFLNLRLGTGTAPSRNTVKARERFDGIPEFQERLDSLVERYRLIDRVPVVESFVDAGAIGVAGAETVSAPAVNALVAQLAALYSPAELAIGAMVGPTWGEKLDWMKWLPHVGSPQSPLEGVHLADSATTGTAMLARLEQIVAERLESKRPKERTGARGPLDPEDSVMLRGAAPAEAEIDLRPEPPCLLVLIADEAPVDRARLIALVERAALAGVLPVWIGPSVDALPAGCRTYLALTGAGTGRVGYVRTGETVDAVEIAQLEQTAAREYARSLAAVADAGAPRTDESDVPRAVSLVSLLGADLARSSDAVLERWRENDSLLDRRPGVTQRPRRAGKLRALVGQGSVDAMHLDLRTQGPHALVGGTTGSGKSEFLQSWVLGMAAEYSPDRVTFLLVDYKGGSAFADCVNLPHAVGLVTDLDQHLVRRALTSLRAELRYREHVLNLKKAKDLLDLEKRGDPDTPPALVIVIDEFAALAGEIPEFVDGVVDIAQRGRSLGIHLIMATQRPAGVIRDNLRANTNLRIALRMADESDSSDVLGDPVAAGFDPAIPGRAVAKTGPGRLTTFQSGYAGGWTSEDAEPASIEIASLGFGAERPWERADDGTDIVAAEPGPTDIARLVAALRAAASGAQVPPPRRPWLPELAASYDVGLLRQRTDAELLIGVADDASTQSQYPVYFRPDTDGNMAVYGASGTGKSVALRTLAVAAAITPRGGPVEVYGVDFTSGGLSMLEGLPHVGAIIAGDDTERIARLFARLTAIIDERAQRYASVRAGDIREYRRLAEQPDEPRILLFIDGMAAFRQEHEFATTKSFALFQQIISDGRSVGVHVVVTADRPATISPSVAASMQRKLVLRLTDDTDYATVDAPVDVLGSGSPPGRGVLDQLEVQVAVLGGTSNTAEQARSIERLATTLRARGVREAPPVLRLPSDIALETIQGSTPGLLPVGVEDESLAPIGVEAEGVLMISGPPGSGRSTTLETLIRGLAAAGDREIHYLGTARSHIGRLPQLASAATGVDDVQAAAVTLAAAVAEGRTGLVVVVESLADFLSTPADAALVALFKALKRSDNLLVAESETSTWASSWPLLLEVKSARRGIALQPDQSEGDLLFRTSFPRAKRSQFPVGRGYLVAGGKTALVQVARTTGAADG
ncbi:FtsK/SpoIIIE domain-containing protein [Herbiconiux sp. L3-i23]|uniref:FtsK/SpoIIIE domain-containing protein n=1 Tax=Herbiconiux sp. L3-i23 TaxID=2905871 RepID=UPI0020633548|nr:FtsK/SpoIIIE domain-containing protein [Herbiconiux sp. L3-i23]BDI21814.1 cell division protein FtsK [Herbiconiux sp. L3-i23]